MSTLIDQISSRVININTNTVPNAPFSPDAAGLNPMSMNYFDNLITIHNAGAENYNVTLSSDNPKVQFYTQDGQWFSKPGYYQSLTMNNLPPGWNLVVGIRVDATTNAAGSQILATMTLTATNNPYGP